jgi:hypothetical protein
VTRSPPRQTVEEIVCVMRHASNDIEKIISTVHARRAPIMFATAGLEL